MANKFLKEEAEQEPEVKQEPAEAETKAEPEPEVKPEVKPEKETEKTTGFTLMTKGNQKFKVCNKCGWIHPADIKVCPYCGNK